MYKVTYNSRASSDLFEIAKYIAEESMSLEIAQNTVSKMRKRIDNRLGIFPLSGQIEAVINEIEYHKIIVGRYSVIYKIIELNDEEDEEVVVVTNVVHEKSEINIID